MHLRFLPNLLKKFQKPQSNPKDPISGTPPNTDAESQQTGPLDLPAFSRVSELNFLLSDDKYAISSEKEERLIASFRFFSYIILILFSIFAGIGMFFTSRLVSLQEEGVALAKSIEVLSGDVTAAREVNKRIDFYKHIYLQRNLLGDKKIRERKRLK